MKILKVIFAIPLLFILALLSAPFIMVALGYAGTGDEAGADRWFARTPLTLWFDFVEKRKDERLIHS